MDKYIILNEKGIFRVSIKSHSLNPPEEQISKVRDKWWSRLFISEELRHVTVYNNNHSTAEISRSLGVMSTHENSVLLRWPTLGFPAQVIQLAVNISAHSVPQGRGQSFTTKIRSNTTDQTELSWLGHLAQRDPGDRWSIDDLDGGERGGVQVKIMSLRS